MTEIMAIWKQQKIQICIGIEFPKSPEKKFGRNLLFLRSLSQKKSYVMSVLLSTLYISLGNKKCLMSNTFRSFYTFVILRKVNTILITIIDNNRPLCYIVLSSCHFCQPATQG